MIKLAVILDDIRSTHNVGSILRSSDCFGVSHVFFAGITPYPKIEADSRLPYMADKLTRAIRKTALGAEDSLAISVHQNISLAIAQARKCGYRIACLEQSKNSIPLTDYTLDTDIALLLGNEIEGLSMQTLEASDVILEIPMFGQKESLNVSVAAAIALYSLRFKGSI